MWGSKGGREREKEKRRREREKEREGERDRDFPWVKRNNLSHN